MMHKRATTAIVVGLAAAVAAWSAPVSAAEQIELPSYEWSHYGPFGTIDQAAAQRGFQVYQQVCQSCHGMELFYFRNLAGIGFTEEQIEIVASEYFIQDGYDDFGDPIEREGRASDSFPDPFPNDAAAAAANGGVVPPDLSVMIKARPSGEDYMTALLMGYEDEPPEGFDLTLGKYYNKYFPGHQISMPQMLYDDMVMYEDGTESTALQNAKDVTIFLAYTAEPHHDERKQLGMRVMLFLIVFAGLMYATKRQLWSAVKH